MIRRLQLLAATLFALYCSTAFGVGLGELELRSALNQQFDAEIVLTNVGALQQDEILPNLASQSDFDRVGVDRNYLLTDLRFKVQPGDDGKFVVLITSSKPIIEPFLNFIVEVIWPTGRILREYTVLLDPPIFGAGGVEKIEPGEVDRAQPGTSTGSSRTERRQIPAAPSVSAGRTEGVVTQDDEYGLTGPGDTLWTIALKVRPSASVSVQQTMLALQRANPEAFINNNINLLKAGHVLRIPDLSEIRTETTQEAIAEVRVQNEEFDEYKTGEVTQLDARRTARRQTP
ncbi:MAG: LysM peptidoglycan-binding domain-containing protein, partial [Gammaproteobacteria bacterium]|nr:LysM peptidoglycan-binding domain-containing protein [Gammaproteobacteria bacterium]